MHSVTKIVSMAQLFSLLSDLVMIVHFSWVLFNLLGFFLVMKFPKLKYFHMGTLTITALLMLAGRVCPLTTLEQKLRWKVNPVSAYKESFLNHYVGKLLYVNLPAWTITAITAALSLIAFWLYFILPYLRKRKGSARIV